MSDLIDELRILAETNIAASNRTLTVAADALESQAKRIAELESEVERLRVDAAIGAVVWKYIDRMNDVVPSDPAERILCEFCHAVQPVMDAAKEQS